MGASRYIGRVGGLAVALGNRSGPGRKPGGDRVGGQRDHCTGCIRQAAPGCRPRRRARGHGAQGFLGHPVPRRPCPRWPPRGRPPTQCPTGLRKPRLELGDPGRAAPGVLQLLTHHHAGHLRPDHQRDRAGRDHRQRRRRRRRRGQFLRYTYIAPQNGGTLDVDQATGDFSYTAPSAMNLGGFDQVQHRGQ